MKNICILGATGSVGLQTLDVIRNRRDEFNLTAVSCHKSVKKIIEIIEEFKPKYAAITDEASFDEVNDYFNFKPNKPNLLKGIGAMETIASLSEVDLVVTSVVGMIGLKATLKAIESGKNIALANKETLVVGGELVTEAALKSNVKLLPVDSEHVAIFQCLLGNDYKDIKRILLTASGGPFRGKKREELRNVSAKDALKHPKWNMGPKISIDSATLINKGLEIIEAHYLFKTSYDKIKVVVHKESIVHSMIEYIDNSVIAQLASTDMRLPISYALNYPNRSENMVQSIDFWNLKSLSFEEPDADTFKGIKLAYEAGKRGGLYPTILNGANEACVDLFLKKSMGFLDISDTIEECLNKFDGEVKPTLNGILEMDSQVKNYIYKRY